MAKIMPVIMCGGSGTRMWPESRESLPKQFIPLIGERSTFQSIVSVVGDPAVFEPAVVITNFDYRFRVAEQLREIGAEAAILLEPDRRDSAAAVGAAAAWAAARDPKTVRRRARGRPCLRGRKTIRQPLRRSLHGGGGRRNRHLRRHARPSGDRLRLHSPRRAAGDRPKGAADRAIRGKARRNPRARLHRGRLPVELGQFRVPRRCHAGGASAFRAGDRRGDRRGGVAREKGSRLRRPRPRFLRRGAEDLDRLCGDGANLKGRWC